MNMLQGFSYHASLVCTQLLSAGAGKCVPIRSSRVACAAGWPSVRASVTDGSPLGMQVMITHGGVAVPAKPHKDAQGRSMRPHNQPQPPTPPCYASVYADDDHEHPS